MALALPRSAAAWESPVPDIVLYCTPAMQAGLALAAGRYRARSGVEVHIFVAPPDGLIGLLKHRARDDVVVADTPSLQAMAAAGLVRPGSVVALGADPFVLIGAAGGSPHETTANQLAAARRVVLTDPTTQASFDGRAVLASAGVPATGVVGVADTPEVVAAVRVDPTLIGLVNATQAAGSPLAVRLSAPPMSVSGALVTLGQSGRAADLLGFIAGPEGEAILHATGLEPAS